jgi:hypothetical protein
MMRRMLVIIGVLLLAIPAVAGTWTSNSFLYKPSTGARGEAEKNTYDSGLDRVDVRLGKEIWVGDPNYGATLQSAVTAIGNNQALLRIPAGTWIVGANLTIPANITLRPERGAILNVTTGVTLTINGGLKAGLYQIFSCTGTGRVVFGAGAVKEIYPEWWQTNATPGTTDMASGLQACLTCTKDSGGLKVKLSSLYGIGSASWVGLNLASASDIEIEGNGWNTGFKLLAAPSQTVYGFETVFKFDTCNNLRIENLKIDFNALEISGISLLRCQDCIINKVYATNSPGTPGDDRPVFVTALGYRNKITNNRTYDVSTAVAFGVPWSDAGINGLETDSTLSGNNFQYYCTSSAYCTGGKILDNKFDVSGAGAQTDGCCLEVSGTDTGEMRGWVISGNDFTQVNNVGLQLSSLDAGDRLSNGLVNNNIFHDCGGIGLYAFGDTTDIVCDGNVFYNNLRGISVTVGAAGGCDRWTISNNHCYDTRSGGSRTQDKGIEISAGSGGAAIITDINILGNECINQVSYGIAVSIAAGQTITGVKVNNNLCKDNGLYGIYIDDGFYGELLGNTCLNNATKDIRINNTAAGAVQLLLNRYDTIQIASDYINLMYGNRTSSTESLFRANGLLNSGASYITGKIAPAQITANQNDYAPPGFATATILRLTSDASRTITGIAGGTDGRVIIVYNFGSYNIVLANNSAGSVAANRIYTGTGSDYTLVPTASAMLVYEGGGGKWRLVH